MKSITLLFLLTTFLNANITTFKSFEASFLQTILDDNNKRITYSGTLYIDSEKNALWEYIAPIKKSLYFINNRLTIIEPELEQVIVKDIQENIDIFSILQHAKKIDATTYKGTYNAKEYILHVEKDVIVDVKYKDDFGNKVTIDFENQKVNKALPAKIFDITLPKEFDVIYE